MPSIRNRQVLVKLSEEMYTTLSNEAERLQTRPATLIRSYLAVKLSELADFRRTASQLALASHEPSDEVLES